MDIQELLSYEFKSAVLSQYPEGLNVHVNGINFAQLYIAFLEQTEEPQSSYRNKMEKYKNTFKFLDLVKLLNSNNQVQSKKIIPFWGNIQKVFYKMYVYN